MRQTVCATAMAVVLLAACGGGVGSAEQAVCNRIDGLPPDSVEQMVGDLRFAGNRASDIEDRALRSAAGAADDAANFMRAVAPDDGQVGVGAIPQDVYLAGLDVWDDINSACLDLGL